VNFTETEYVCIKANSAINQSALTPCLISNFCQAYAFAALSSSDTNLVSDRRLGQPRCGDPMHWKDLNGTVQAAQSGR